MYVIILKMFDQKLDLLYGICFSQMIRSKLSPTYVEKRILDETVNGIRSYLLQFVEELKKKVDDDKKRCMESYLTWDAEFYKKDGEVKEQLLSEFEKTIKKTNSNEFLEKDFSVTKTELDTLYPDFLPKSLSRQTLWEQWVKIKEKHD